MCKKAWSMEHCEAPQWRSVKFSLSFKDKTLKACAGNLGRNTGRADFVVCLLWISNANQATQNKIKRDDKIALVYTKGLYNFTHTISISRVWVFFRYCDYKPDFPSVCLPKTFLLSKFESCVNSFSGIISPMVPGWPERQRAFPCIPFSSILRHKPTQQFCSWRTYLCKIALDVFLFIATL